MKYLIASHGEVAQGWASAVAKIAGCQKHVEVINAYTDEETLDNKVKSILAENCEESWVIFTDLLQGSVNQLMMKEYCRPNLRIVTGVNLYLILAVMKLEETNDFDAQLSQCIRDAQSQVCYVNSLLEEKGSDQ